MSDTSMGQRYKENYGKENRRKQKQENKNCEQEYQANYRKENRRNQKRVNKNSEQEYQANLCAKTGAHQTTM